RGGRLGFADPQPRALLLHDELQQAPPRLLPGRHRLAVDLEYRVAALQPGRRRGAARRRRADDGFRFLDAADENHRAERDRKQEIRHRPRGQDRYPAPHVLAVERTMSLLGLDGSFALVEHLHVASERNRSDHPFGPVATAPERPQALAEPDREAQHLDSERARDRKMTELVEHDEHAQRDQGRKEVVDEDVHAACDPSLSTILRACALPLESASSTSASVRSGPPPSALTVSSITAVICRNGRRPSRKAATATSFAALSVAGADPPLRSPSEARPSAGNRPKS